MTVIATQLEAMQKPHVKVHTPYAQSADHFEPVIHWQGYSPYPTAFHGQQSVGESLGAPASLTTHLPMPCPYPTCCPYPTVSTSNAIPPFGALPPCSQWGSSAPFTPGVAQDIPVPSVTSATATSTTSWRKRQLAMPEFPPDLCLMPCLEGIRHVQIEVLFRDGRLGEATCKFKPDVGSFVMTTNTSNTKEVALVKGMRNPQDNKMYSVRGLKVSYVAQRDDVKEWHYTVRKAEKESMAFLQEKAKDLQLPLELIDVEYKNSQTTAAVTYRRTDETGNSEKHLEFLKCVNTHFGCRVAMNCITGDYSPAGWSGILPDSPQTKS